MSTKLLEERQAEMRERLAKEKTNSAVIRPAFNTPPVESKIVVGSDAELQSGHAILSSNRMVV